MNRRGGSAHSFDRIFHACIERLTLGLSPASLMLAYRDWLTHLAIAPAKQAELLQKAARKFTRFFLYSCKGAIPRYDDNEPGCCSEPLPQDKRFQDPAWQNPPFNLIYQSILLTQQWGYNATTDVRGVSAHLKTPWRLRPGRFWTCFHRPITS